MIGSSSPAAKGNEDVPQHSLGARLLNMLGVNLTGVDFLRTQDRAQALRKYQQNRRDLIDRMTSLAGPQYEDAPAPDVTPPAPDLSVRGMFGSQAPAPPAAPAP